MNTDVWEPNSSSANIDINQIPLHTYIEAGDENIVISKTKQLSTSEVVSVAKTMKLSPEQWQVLSENLNETDIIKLIRFYTAAELHHNSLDAGNSSPVIALNQVLRARGKPLDFDTLTWIKSHTRNRFLPNGSVF